MQMMGCTWDIFAYANDGVGTWDIFTYANQWAHMDVAAYANEGMHMRYSYVCKLRGARGA